MASSPQHNASFSTNAAHRQPISSNPSSPLNARVTRLGRSPGSPVKMKQQQDNWAQPSSAVIESRDSDSQRQSSDSSDSLEEERLLTLQAPERPPPALPIEFSQPEGTVRRVNAGSLEHPVFGDDIDCQLDSRPGENNISAAPHGNTEQAPVQKMDNRNSRETDTSISSPSLSNPQTSTEVSAATSSSSVSGGTNDYGQHRKSEDASTVSSSAEDPASEPQMVAQLDYHHQPFTPKTASFAMNVRDPRGVSSPDLSEPGQVVNRHLTPISSFRRSSMPRPQSAYSVHSDHGRSGQYGTSSPRVPSAHSSRRSPNFAENRLSTYVELLNVPYPQPAPAPLTVDNTQLRNVVGSNASLLSSQKTLDMYRQNVKKTSDFSLQYSFAVYLISTAQENGLDVTMESKKKPSTPKPGHSPQQLYCGRTRVNSYRFGTRGTSYTAKARQRRVPVRSVLPCRWLCIGTLQQGQGRLQLSFSSFRSGRQAWPCRVCIQNRPVLRVRLGLSERSCEGNSIFANSGIKETSRSNDETWESVFVGRPRRKALPRRPQMVEVGH